MNALTILLFFLLKFKGFQTEDDAGICYWDSVEDPKFYISPAGNDQDENSLATCKKRCLSAAEEYSPTIKYAGIQEENFCVCAESLVDSKLCKACSDCNNTASIQTWFSAITKAFINNITVVSQRVEGEAHLVEFEVDPTLNPPVQYSFHYDEGCPNLIANLSTLLTHKYYLSGEYTVAVTAYNKEAELTAVAFEKVSIKKNLTEHVELVCPETVNITEIAECVLTTTGGSDLNISIIIQLNNHSLEYFEEPLADETTFAVGPGIPQFSYEGILNSFPEKYTIIMFDSVFTQPGFITGFEMYAYQEGDIEIKVLQVAPSDKYCLLNEDCQDKYFEPNYRGCCASNPQDIKMSEKQRVETVTKIQQGYQYIGLQENEYIEVFPGDLLALTSKGGKLSSREKYDFEVSDYASDGYDQTGDPTDRRHFLRAHVTSPIQIYLRRTFNNTGIYTIRTILSSMYTNEVVENSSQIIVESVLQGLILTIDHEIRQLEKSLTFTATLEIGSDIEVLWMLDKFKNISETYPGNCTGLSFHLNYTFQEEGDFVVTVFVWNPFASLNATVDVKIQALFKPDEWNLTSDEPQNYPPGNVSFTIQYNGEKRIKEISIEVDFGDGTEKERQDLIEFSRDNSYSFSHVYETENIFNVSVKLYNNISQIDLYTPVKIRMKIAFENIDAKYIEWDETEYRDGLGDEKSIFPFGSTIKIGINKKIGSVDKWFVNWGDGSEQEEYSYENNDITKRYSETGNYTIVVYGTNEVETKSDSIDKTITISPLINYVRVKEDDQSNKDKNETKIFRIDYSPWRCCIYVDFGDGGEIEKYGNDTICNSNSKYSDGEIKGPLLENRFLLVKRAYVERKYYELKVIAFNEFNSAEKTLAIVVNHFPYSNDSNDSKPFVFIPINSSDITNPIKYRSSDGYKIETEAKLPNIDTVFDIITNWSVKRVDPQNGNELDPDENLISARHIPSWNKTALFLLPRYLKYGVYKATYYFYFTTKIMDPDYPKYASAYTYIEVIKTNLSAVIVKGNLFRVMKGWNESLLLDPQNLSVDLDDLTAKDFIVTWYCSRLGDGSTMPDEVDSLQEIPSPSDRDRSHEDKGGCFGHGPGFINVGNGTWDLKMQSLYQHNVSYVITVKIEKDTRTSTTSLILDVVHHNVSHIHIECGVSALCVTSPSGLIINPSTRLSMKAICLECDKNVFYHWTIKEVVEADGTMEFKELPGSDDFINGEGKPFVSVSIDFFNQYPNLNAIICSVTIYPKFSKEIAEALMRNNESEENFERQEEREEEEGPDEERNWKRNVIDFSKFKHRYLEGKNETYTRRSKRSVVNKAEEIGTTTMKFIINKPPEKGNCFMTNVGKVSLIDSFEIECKDWVDPEGIGIAFYEIYTIDNKGLTNILAVSTNTRFSVILKPGRLDIKALIYDKLGAKTKNEIAVVEVEGPSGDDLKNFIKSDQLRLIKVTGNQFLYMQALQAIGETMKDTIPKNAAFPEPGSEEFNDAVEMSKLITDNLNSLKDITMISIEDLKMVSLSMGSVVGSGKLLDKHGQKSAINLAGSLINLLHGNNTMKFTSPVQAKDFAAGILSVVGAVVCSTANTVLAGEIIPHDLDDVNNIDYDGGITVGKSVVIPSDPQELEIFAIKEDTLKKAKKYTQIIDKLSDDLSTLMLSNLVPGEDSIEINTTSGLSAVFQSTDGKSMNGSNIDFTLVDSIISIPDVCSLTNQNPDECIDDIAVGYSVLLWEDIKYLSGEGADSLAKNTKMVEIEVYSGEVYCDSKLDVSNSSIPIDIIIPRKLSDDNSSSEEPLTYTPKMKWFEDMVYHQIPIDQPGSGISLWFSPHQPEETYVLMLRHDKKPKLDNHDMSWIVGEQNFSNGAFSVFIGSDEIRNRTGYFYLGITQLNGTVEFNGENVTITSDSVNRNWTSNYSIQTTGSSCLYYNEKLESWKTDGCEIVFADFQVTHCRCTHLTVFGSSFVVAPNSINFDYVFANASFTDNLTIYITIIITLVIFIAFLIWARRKDKKDIEKVGALPLPDNDPDHKYVYEILVFTGDVTGASTDSKISFILSGDSDETEIRNFGTHPRKIFRRNGADVFVMTVPKSLGQLQFLRIWHDNTGKGDFASWNLNCVTFRDVQTGEKFLFIANSWFALEKGDQQIDRIIPVADREQLTEFSHLFNTTSRKNLSDGHLWFSVFLRPPRSRFTRCQRVCSCMALLYLSMLVNAMWYGVIPDKPNQYAVSFGPFSLSPEQIAIGFFSNLIIFPPSFLIIFLFRKSRPRKLRPSRIDKALGKTYNAREETSNNELILKFKKKRRFTLPWWCSLVAWFLCIACMLVSVFFLWAYGIQFGNEKTKKWITSLILSFFFSVFVTQPIKVFLLAMFFSAICKKINIDEDDADDDEQDPHLDFDEQWLIQPTVSDRRKVKKVAYQGGQNAEIFAEARRNRENELAMWKILKEIFAYMFFLWIVGAIGYGTHEPEAYWMHKTLYNNFIQPRNPNSFLKIKHPHDFWDWASTVLLKNFRCSRTYNNQPPFGMRGFLTDGVNRMIGYAIMRQVRVEKDVCSVPREVRHIMNCTAVRGSFLKEDHQSYSLKWSSIEKSDSKNFVQRAFQYRSEESLKGNPFVGHVDVYSGGGFVYELTKPTNEIKEDFDALEKNKWIDEFTRLVIVEFYSYNAQVNLFAVVNLYVELVAGGGLISDYVIDGIQLLPYQNGSRLFVFCCQIIFVFFILYYTFRELRNFCKLGRSYFKQYGTYIEIFIILFSYAAIILFILKYMVVQKSLKEFRETQGNVFISLKDCHYLDSFYNYLVAFIIFMSMVKFNKMLKFNKRLSSFTDALRQCANDLWSFGLFFLIFFLAFGQTFYLMFSSSVQSYTNPTKTLLSLFSITLNKFSFKDYQEASDFGPVAFFAFAFLTSIILINLFLTIIIRSFESVKHDLSNKSNDYEIVDFMFRRIKTVFGLEKPRARALPIPTAERVTDDGEPPTQQFPQKVDRLLSYINTLYFDGKMDLQSKQMFQGKKVNFKSRTLLNSEGSHVFKSD